MKRVPSIFISYNPNSHEEETLAVRLQTIGAVSGFEMFLPDRYGKNYVDDETVRRIKSADYFIIFATNKLSRIVLEEISIAYEHFQDPSKILVICNMYHSNSIGIDHSEMTLVEFNPQAEGVEAATKAALDIISKKEKSNQNKNEIDGLLAFLGIGLGLLALISLFSKDE
ncbi:MAG: hypothetical protein ABJG47_14710 [Ekhidna sp.]